MAERASVFEAIQIGVESTPGTAVRPNRRLLSMEIVPSFEIATNRFRPRGNKFNTVQTKGKDSTMASITGQPDYTEIVYPLGSVLTTPVVAAAGAGWTHTYSPSSTAPDTPKIFTLESGADSVRAMRSTHVMVTDFGLNYTRDNIELTGTAMGQKLLEDRVRYIIASGTVSGGTYTVTVGANTTAGIAFGATAGTLQTAITGLASVGAGNAVVTALGGNLPTGIYAIVFADTIDLTTCSINPASLTGGGTYTMSRLASGATESALVPIIPDQTSIYLDVSAAALGTTKLLRVFRCNWQVGNRYSPVWPIDAAQTSWAAYAETPVQSRAVLRVAADAQGMALVQNLRAGDRRFLRIHSVGALYEASHNYELRIDQSLTIAEVGKVEDEDGVVAFDLTCEGAHDATWTRALQVYVKTTTAAI